jgi:glycosyltransferase involved in cell wall biosynthesis
MSHPIHHIAVLIPARNEAELLPRCIESVIQCEEFLPRHVTCDIIVAVDRSTDRTLHIARSMLRGFGVAVTTNAGVVGVARALAADVALNRYGGREEQCWLANTDADCVVPDTWLADQLRLANAGAYAVAGIVDVDDFSEHHLAVAQLFRDSYIIHPDGTHPHVHGANIGMRADVYRESGGWSPLATAEDHDLWHRLSASGYHGLSVADLRVLTSGRRTGRAPQGFAQALSAHNEALI